MGVRTTPPTFSIIFYMVVAYLGYENYPTPKGISILIPPLSYGGCCLSEKQTTFYRSIGV